MKGSNKEEEEARREARKDPLNPYNLQSLALEFIDAEKYTEAVASLVQVINTAPAESVLVRQACRMVAEIMLVEGEQAVNAIQLLCFSHVAPVHWPGTMGIAAKMLQQPWSRVGDVVLDLSDKRGALLVKSDKWCRACNAQEDTQACSGCGVAYYCCKDHQQKDWLLHKYDCVTNKYKSQDLWNDTFVYQEKREELNRIIGDALLRK